MSNELTADKLRSLDIKDSSMIELANKHYLEVKDDSLIKTAVSGGSSYFISRLWENVDYKNKIRKELYTEKQINDYRQELEKLFATRGFKLKESISVSGSSYYDDLISYHDFSISWSKS